MENSKLLVKCPDDTSTCFTYWPARTYSKVADIVANFVNTQRENGQIADQVRIHGGLFLLEPSMPALMVGYPVPRQLCALQTHTHTNYAQDSHIGGRRAICYSENVRCTISRNCVRVR